MGRAGINTASEARTDETEGMNRQCMQQVKIDWSISVYIADTAECKIIRKPAWHGGCRSTQNT